MAKTAVLNKEDKTLIKVVSTAEEKKEFDGRDDVVFMVSKNFEPTEQFKTWEEMIGKVKPVEEGEAKPKAAAAPLEGPYYMLKPLPPVAADHPKKPIWDAIVANEGKTCADAKAACPAENPSRKTSGKYTFASEFRYFLKTHYVALGEKPEGYDYTAHAKPVKEEKAEKPEGEAKPKKAKKDKKEKKEEAATADAGTTGEASNESAEGEQPAA